MISVVLLVLELVLLSVLKSIGIEERPVALIASLIATFAIAYVSDIQRDDKLDAVRSALILGFFFRMCLLFFDVYGRNIYVLPNSGSDAEVFYNEAYVVSNGGTSIRGFFVTVVGTLMRYIGVSRLYTQFLLMLCSMVALHMGDKILRECHVDDEIRRKTMYLVAFLPNFAILSSIFLRESIVTMFIAIALYFYICWMTRGGFWPICIAIASVFAAMTFHSGTIAVLVGFIPGFILYNREKKSLSLSIRNVIWTIVLITLIVYFLNRYGDFFLRKFSRMDSLEDVANTRDVARSSYARFVGNSNSISNMIIYTIPRLVFFLFSPMPFQWRGVSDIIAFLFSSLFYMTVIIRAWMYLRSKDETNRQQVILLLIVALCSMFVFAWGVSNTGSAVRHRDKTLILYSVLFALCEERKGGKNTSTSYKSKYIR